MKETLEDLKAARPDPARAYSMRGLVMRRQLESRGGSSGGGGRFSLPPVGGIKGARRDRPLSLGTEDLEEEDDKAASCPASPMGIGRSPSMFFSSLRGGANLLGPAGTGAGMSRGRYRVQYCIHVNRVRQLVEHYAELMKRPYSQV